MSLKFWFGNEYKYHGSLLLHAQDAIVITMFAKYINNARKARNIQPLSYKEEA